MDHKRLEGLSIGNAAGTVRTLEQVKKLLGSAVTRIKVGTIARKARAGNTAIPGGHIYFLDEETGSTYNALGMPDVGIKKFRAILKEMVRLAHAAGKELWVSVAGENVREFARLAAICFACGADGVELNLGCPNVHDAGVSKPIFSYHPELVALILDHMDARFMGSAKKISVKISPVPSEGRDSLLERLVQAINRSHSVTEVTATNTLPNQEALGKDGKPLLAFIPQGGTEVMHKGGLGGKLLKRESLRVAGELRSSNEKAPCTLMRSTRLTVVGGISSGADLLEYFRETDEIDGFEVGSAYYETEDPSIFSDIPAELVALLPAA